MPQEKTEYVLTEQEVSDLFDESLRKYKNVLGQCHEIYHHLKNELELEEEEVELLEQTANHIVYQKQEQKKRVLNNKMERVGFQVADPYYLACLKPISPLIYRAFFQNGLTSNKVETQFHIYAVNEGFEDLGGNAHYKFKRKFYAEGRNYYKRLKARGILKKFPDKDVPGGEPSNKHIMMSWVTDYLDKMRKAAQNNDKMNLVKVK